MEHRLIVASVEFFAGRRVECSDGAILVNEEILGGPLQLQADGHLSP
jgi:hypothetical protein